MNSPFFGLQPKISLSAMVKMWKAFKMGISSLFANFRKSFNAKILITVAGLHAVFIVLFDKITAFAPDENYYIGVFSWLYRSDFTIDGGIGWQVGSLNALRIIYLPAKILSVLGFSDFYAVRILSALCSLFSIYLLLRMAPSGVILRISIRYWIVTAFLIPSVFLWSSLGLRESFIFLSYISIFYLLGNAERLSSKKRYLLLITASSSLLITKNYLYVLLIISILISVAIFWLKRQSLEKHSVKLLSALLIPLILFPPITSNIIISSKESVKVKLQAPTPTEAPTLTVPARGQTIHELSKQLDLNPIFSWLAKSSGIEALIIERSRSSYLPGDSSKLIENFNQLQTQKASLRDPISLIKGIYSFLFVPTPFVDNGSFFLNAQSYESFVWYLYYLLFLTLLFGLFKARYSLDLLTLCSTLFSLGFIVLSALIETNDGTSVRHRAVFLLAILVILATAKQNESKSTAPAL